MNTFTQNVYTDRFVDLTLFESGRQQCGRGHSHGPATRDHYLFHYILSGKGILYVDDSDGHTSSFELDAGRGFLIYPGQVTMYVADGEDPWEYVWVLFDGLCVPDLLQRTELSKAMPVYQTQQTDLRDKMAASLLDLCERTDAPTLHTIASLYSFAAYLIDSAKGGHAVAGRRIRDRYIRIALDYIERNYSTKVRIEDIASECGIDRSYFGKLFHAVMGQSPQSFLLQYRMMRACSLLQETDMTIASVGAAVGYDNALHFSRAFKNQQGMAPREWRARNRRTAPS